MQNEKYLKQYSKEEGVYISLDFNLKKIAPQYQLLPFSS